ncbi:hypothetical protein WS70_13855 [Burkholderia mayonis]|uniref:Uncharacterized protein n=1 Tax=Burkholderia mayonis TaxID=1385591 RepID=A0A1B4FGD5_9BURK|nr:hypothetical protein WS70_13855 [Burkholderia mayonis]KVE42431.1 hypothetical protein WS69_05005 [Burkholderia sp. BDU5]KVE45156.1 hypothetical protein WS70_05915 [Burkholderia mayonis]
MLGPNADRDASSRGAAWRLREMMREKRRPGIEPDANRRGGPEPNPPRAGPRRRAGKTCGSRRAAVAADAAAPAGTRALAFAS